MENSEISSRTFFSTLALIHAGMFIGPVLFLSIAFYINAAGGYKESIDIDMFNWLIPLVAVIGFASSILFFRIKIQNVRNIQNFKSRLVAYQTALLIKWMLLEGSAIFAVVGYLISGEMLFFYIAIIVILIHLINRPSRHKLAMDLQLNSIERLLIQDPNAMIS